MPADLLRFRDLTIGQIVVMGRLTWESLPDKYRPLPNRHNIVLSRTSLVLPKEVEQMKFKHVLELPPDNEVFVIGGSSLYEQFLPHANRILMTQVLDKFSNADRFFPTTETKVWYDHETPKYYPADGKNRYSCVTRDLRRIRNYEATGCSGTIQKRTTAKDPEKG